MRKTCLKKTGKVGRKAGFYLHKICLVAIAVVLSASEMAVSAGGFTQAIGTIQGYQTQVKDLMNAIAAVICLVGAFNVYFKMRAFV